MLLSAVGHRFLDAGALGVHRQVWALEGQCVGESSTDAGSLMVLSVGNARNW